MTAGLMRFIDVKITLGNIITLIGVLLGGVWFMAKTENRIDSVEDKVVRLERSIESGAAAIFVKDERAAQKIEVITRDLNDLKVTVGRVDEAVRFLVQQERRRPAQ